jgi:hypothetical protein
MLQILWIVHRCIIKKSWGLPVVVTLTNACIAVLCINVHALVANLEAFSVAETLNCEHEV